jgi:hypothetical protein
MPQAAPNTGNAMSFRRFMNDLPSLPFIVFDGGSQNLTDKGMSGFTIAVIDWEGTLSLAMRWNGFPGTIGFPLLRSGKASWFVIPQALQTSILTASLIDEEMRLKAKNLLEL